MELNKANKNLFIDILKGKFNHSLYKHTIDFNYSDEILTVTRILKNDKIFIHLLSSDNVKIKYSKNYKIFFYKKNSKKEIIFQNFNNIDELNISDILSTNIPENPNLPKIILNNDTSFEFFNIEKPELKKIIDNILIEEVKNSNNVDFGLMPEIGYLKFISNEKINNLRVVKNDDFKEIKKGEIEFNDFLKKYSLSLVNNNNQRNFEPILVVANGHISTLLIDLRQNNNNIEITLKDRLYSFDSSLHHFKDKDSNYVNLLNNQYLQLTGCCTYWTINFIDECLKLNDIDLIKKECSEGHVYLAVASEVSNIIDKNIDENLENLINFSNISSNGLLNIKLSDNNFYIIKDDLFKSHCVNIDTINSLFYCNCSEKDRDTLKKLTIKQQQNIFDINYKTAEPINRNIEIFLQSCEALTLYIDNKKIDCDNILNNDILKFKNAIIENYFQAKIYKNNLIKKYKSLNDNLLIQNMVDPRVSSNSEYEFYNKYNNQALCISENFKKIEENYEKSLYDIKIKFKKYEEVKDYFKERKEFYKSIEIIDNQETMYEDNLNESKAYNFKNIKNVTIDKTNKIISFETNNRNIFKDIEEIKIKIPETQEKIDEIYINNLYKEIFNKGFDNNFIKLDSVYIKRKDKNDFEKLGQFTNKIIAESNKKTNLSISI